MVEAFAAVTVPSELKAGLSPAIFEKSTFLNSSSSEIKTGSPFFCGMLTGAISATNLPPAVASADFLYESMAN